MDIKSLLLNSLSFLFHQSTGEQNEGRHQRRQREAEENGKVKRGNTEEVEEVEAGGEKGKRVGEW